MTSSPYSPTRSTAVGTLGNILWLFVAGGGPLAIGYAIAGLVMGLTIIGIPFAIAAMRLAVYAALPFDRRVVDRPNGIGSGVLGFLFNLLWLLIAGWALAIGHLVCALGCAISIVGIPFAWAHLKLAWLALWPFGKEIV
ncbi:MAG: YccF domain-containing protein [Myxococcales bacterium]|nr:YccF domain-containing protein [Myxococcales bacterium]